MTSLDDAPSRDEGSLHPAAGLDATMAELYEELHRLAAKYFRAERPGHTLQPTALVHEAYLKLARAAAPRWQSHEHFLALAARVMRQVLVNHERDRRRLKRGGGRGRMTLGEGALASDDPAFDLLALDDALEGLAAQDARKARVVELHYFAGMNVEEAAEALGISLATAKRDWTFARAWLIDALGERKASESADER